MYCFAVMFGCCELASTFNVLTWRVMPDAGEAVPGGSDDLYYAN